MSRTCQPLTERRAIDQKELRLCNERNMLTLIEISTHDDMPAGPMNSEHTAHTCLDCHNTFPVISKKEAISRQH